MNFRDYLHRDLQIFINPKEFGVPITIEGETILVVLDDEIMKERQLVKQIEGELHNEELLFYVPKIDLSFYPRPDNIVFFDDVRWSVVDIQEDEGLFTVTCERVSG